MTSRNLLVSLAVAAFITSTPLPASAADAGNAPGKAPQSSEAARSAALLSRAAQFMKERGEQSLATFSQAGSFQDGDLYVYVLDMDGNFLASGGASTALIGRNVRDMPDLDGQYFFREMLDRAQKHDTGRVEYRWFNPIHGTVEPKIATFKRVGNRLLVVGYYQPQSTIEQARSLLWRAVHELKQHGESAFERFTNLNGGFVQDDLYVFVIDIDDGVVRAHGGSPREVGRRAEEMVDADGKHFGREMIELAKAREEADLYYAWRNPVTRKVERKHTYIVRVGRYLVGAGAYIGPVR